MKYSKNFERDYDFYLNNKDIFNFCGAPTKYQAMPDEEGYTAKECLLSIDSRGKNISCCEPELLNQLLLCKASINFHIKMWADGVGRGVLLKQDLMEIQQDYNCPDWVINAIENQCKKLYSQQLE